MPDIDVAALTALARQWIAAENDADDYGPSGAYDGRDCAEMLLDALKVNHEEQP